MASLPLVSCLMVTAGRVRLAERAVRCFTRQTWPHRELVILDDGPDDYSAMLRRYAADADSIRYHRIERQAGLRLGGLRNRLLDLARGEYCVQWDDDEWYHPQRIEAQLEALGSHAGGSVLRDTLMHLATPDFTAHPYRTGLRSGTPGTLLHRRTERRYPNVPKREDSLFRDALRREMRIVTMDGRFSHLFIRCFHGSNTWDARHFVERLHYTTRNKVEYAYARYVRRDLFAHPAFHLTELERGSVTAFLEDSRELGLL